MPSLDSDFSLPNAIRRLKAGDFTWSDPLFDGQPCRIVEWVEAGKFDKEPEALAEALSSACFNGRTEVARYLLDRGVDPAAGNGTGMNAIHWAANRGQLEVVKLLLERKAPLEIRNMYGGTVLGATVWAACNEPRPNQVQVIETLLEAGADVKQAEYPSGREDVDALLRKFGATA